MEALQPTKTKIGTSLPNRLRSVWRKHLRPIWEDYHWPLIWAMGVAAVVLGWIGFGAYYRDTRSALDILYLALQLFVMESGSVPGHLPWQLETARWLAPTVAAYTATRALAVLFKEQLRQVRMQFISDHVVICGLGKMGSLLAKTFHDEGYRVVVIEKDAENDSLPPCREHGALAFVGSATDPLMLRKAHVHRAGLLISVCGSDGANAEVSMHARDLVQRRSGNPLTCLVHIVDLHLCQLLREREIATQAADSFRLEFFNVFESGARAMLNDYPAYARTPNPPQSSANLLVIGLGNMGESLVVLAAREWRALYRASGSRMTVIILDREAEHRVQALCLKYPQLQNVCDLRTLQIDTHSPEFQRAAFLIDEHGLCPLTAIYVCVDDETTALAAGLSLMQRLRHHKIPIIVRMAQDTGLTALLRGEPGTSSFENLHAFGMLTRTCKPALLLGGTHETLARAIHEDYVRHQERLGKSPATNPSMVPWDELSEDLRESNRLQADHIGLKLAAVGCGITPLMDWDADRFEFRPGEIEAMAQMEHERWNAERCREGWKYAPGPNDLQKKTSPHLISWDKLPEEIKELDRNTVRGLPRFLASAGFQIYRVK